MIQRHIRTVEISYPFGFDSSEKQLLNLELEKYNIINVDKWDTELPSYETQTITETIEEYTVIMYNGELVFNYLSDAKSVIRQLLAQGLEVNEEPARKMVSTEKEIDPRWRGSTILFLDAPYHFGAYSYSYLLGSLTLVLIFRLKIQMRKGRYHGAMRKNMNFCSNFTPSCSYYWLFFSFLITLHFR